MIIRVVKMVFIDDEVENFVALFDHKKETIRSFEGCSHVELWADQERPGLMFTYSHWDSPEALENYRNSDFFRSTWKATKAMFAEKAEAWSLIKR